MRCEECTRTNPERRCVVTFREWYYDEYPTVYLRQAMGGSTAAKSAWNAATAQSAAEIAALRAEVERLNEIFDLRHKADARAILQWRSSGEGRDMVSPDHADLVCYLGEKIEFADHFTTMLQAEVERLRAGNEALRRDLSEAKDSIQEYRWGDDL